jgi:hypothetical protein
MDGHVGNPRAKEHGELGLKRCRALMDGDPRETVSPTVHNLAYVGVKSAVFIVISLFGL